MIDAKDRVFLLLIAATLSFGGIGIAEARELQPLDGTWQIVFDPNNKGRQKQWFRPREFPAGASKGYHGAQFLGADGEGL